MRDVHTEQVHKSALIDSVVRFCLLNEVLGFLLLRFPVLSAEVSGWKTEAGRQHQSQACKGTTADESRDRVRELVNRQNLCRPCMFAHFTFRRRTCGFHSCVARCLYGVLQHRSLQDVHGDQVQGNQQGLHEGAEQGQGHEQQNVQARLHRRVPHQLHPSHCVSGQHRRF